MISARAGPAFAHPPTRYHHCGSCGVFLYCQPEEAGEGWKVARGYISARQCLARLSALAKELDLEVEGPQADDLGDWHYRLWVKHETGVFFGQRDARVTGEGTSEEDALQDAVYDAEKQGLI